MKKRKSSPWLTLIITILFLWVLAHFFASIASSIISEDNYGNIALIRINGVIVADDADYMFSESTTSSTEIVEFIKKADKSQSVKAILFEINSPGGSAVASSEIAAAIKEINKTTVSLIREMGTSGAYWAASATDHIIANPLSITGSIGVISSYLEFSGLMEKYGVGYERLVSGKYKDMGSLFRNLTAEEQDLFQEKLDIIHDFFITEVAENRGLNRSYVKDISTGIFYLGSEAYMLGLIDELGDKTKAEEYLKDKLDITEIRFAEYKKEKTFFDIISKVLNKNSFSLSQEPLVRT